MITYEFLFLAFISVGFGFLLGRFFFHWLDKRRHPDKCPICGEDIEHLDICFGCPFVVVDEWEECEDCCYKAPSSGHCGLKDKQFLVDLELKRARKIIEDL